MDNSQYGDKEHVKTYVDKLSFLLKSIKDKMNIMKKQNDVSHHVHELNVLHTEVSFIRDFFKNNLKNIRKPKK